MSMAAAGSHVHLRAQLPRPSPQCLLCALTLWSAAKDLALFCESAGGLALRHGSSAVLVDSTIADCRASNSFGGGVIARAANLTLEGGSRIERCWSRGGGGALLAKDSNVALLNGSVIGESYSNVMGGGLHLGSGCTQSATPRTHNTPRACSQPPQRAWGQWVRGV